MLHLARREYTHRGAHRAKIDYGFEFCGSAACDFSRANTVFSSSRTRELPRTRLRGWGRVNSNLLFCFDGGAHAGAMRRRVSQLEGDWPACLLLGFLSCAMIFAGASASGISSSVTLPMALGSR